MPNCHVSHSHVICITCPASKELTDKVSVVFLCSDSKRKILSDFYLLLMMTLDAIKSFALHSIIWLDLYVSLCCISSAECRVKVVCSKKALAEETYVDWNSVAPLASSEMPSSEFRRPSMQHMAVDSKIAGRSQGRE